MTIFWAVVLPIVFIGTVLYAIHKVRRAAHERRQRSDERAAELLANLQTQNRQTPATAPSAPETARAAFPAAQTARAPRMDSPLARRARLLTDAQRLLFLVLRAALPEHLIMAHVRIVDLLDLPQGSDALERDARLRALARERLDFVVCDSDLAPVAAIVLYAAGIDQVPDERTKIEALREIGVRFLRFRADSVPRPAELRNFVLT